MKIVEFSKQNVELYKDSKVLIIADYRNVKNEDGDKTIQSKLADKYDLELYSVVCFTRLMVSVLLKYYGGYEVWVVDESLIVEFDRCLSLLLENSSIYC